MKALSLWQPWASAIAIGSKRIETRGWGTRYRGPLVIHAAKRKNRSELWSHHSCWNWIGAMAPLKWRWDREGGGDIDRLPFGALIAVCDLVDCRPTDSFTQAELDAPRLPDMPYAESHKWTERQMGDFDLGRFGWVLANVRAFKQPVPFPGRQQLFDVPDEIVAGALA